MPLGYYVCTLPCWQLTLLSSPWVSFWNYHIGSESVLAETSSSPETRQLLIPPRMVWWPGI